MGAFLRSCALYSNHLPKPSYEPAHGTTASARPTTTASIRRNLLVRPDLVPFADFAVGCGDGGFGVMCKSGVKKVRIQGDAQILQQRHDFGAVNYVEAAAHGILWDG